MKLLAPSLAALGFLTRLGPARLLTPQELAASLPWFPVAGLVMGALLAAPFHFGFLKGHALIQAWLLAGINVFLTRGLHWDGWADLWDAWGSGAQGETFWSVLKDSRTGAFGVMGLVLGLGGQVLLYAEVAHAHALAVVVWACVLGRTAGVALAWSGKQLARPGLAQAFLCGATRARLLGALLLCLALGAVLCAPAVLVASALLACLGLTILVRLARSRQGMNGDFLGAAIVWGELSALLGWLAATGGKPF